MLRLYFWWLSLGIFSVAALGIASAWLGFYVPLFVQLLALGIPFVIAQLRIQSNPSPIEQKISDRIREFDECWQGNFRKFFLKLPAIIRKLLWQENRPRFHIDRKIAEWSCYFGVVPLLVLGFFQASKFAGSYKGIVYPIPPLLFAYILVYDAKNFKVEAEIAELGYRAEEKIDELLQPFVAQGGIISQPCRQEGNRLEDIDAFLSMPSGDGFAISVKNIGTEGDRVRVSFDSARQRFRYRRGRRSGRRFFSTEPTLEHKNLVRRFLSDGLIPSCRLHLILAFPSHVELNIHENSPVEEIRGHQFLKFNGVWVISDQDLALLIEALRHA